MDCRSRARASSVSLMPGLLMTAVWMSSVLISLLPSMTIFVIGLSRNGFSSGSTSSTGAVSVRASSSRAPSAGAALCWGGTGADALPRGPWATASAARLAAASCSASRDGDSVTAPSFSVVLTGLPFKSTGCDVLAVVSANTGEAVSSAVASTIARRALNV